MKTPLLYARRATSMTRVGDLLIGSEVPIRIQTMANTDTNDIERSVEQAKRCFAAGAELLRYTTQGSREAESLKVIREKTLPASLWEKTLSASLGEKTLSASLEGMGREEVASGKLNVEDVKDVSGERVVPLVADIHFNPNVADLAAQYVEKVRINPGNYIDPARQFKHLEYTDEEYAEELKRLRARFVQLLDICKAHHTAIRIGVNHGSLSDRIMSRYGDTPAGMVESCLEFLRVAVAENFHDIVLSIKASNTKIMVETVRLLVERMDAEDMHFPLHLGVTEAGEGEDGRVKSAVGIGALLADGIGDTIRVSLSEAPEAEIPVARALRDYFADPESIRYHGVELEVTEVSASGTETGGVKQEPEAGASGMTGDECVRYVSGQTDWALMQLQAAAECGRFLWGMKPDCKLVLVNEHFSREALDKLALDIKQAAGLIRYKTEYVSCPSCGRTLFNIEEVIREVRQATGHLKGLKIGIMGCIVNGPGEMADADYGYVGAARGKISLYRQKECVVKNIPQEEAVEKLIELIKADGKWT